MPPQGRCAPLARHRRRPDRVGGNVGLAVELASTRGPGGDAADAPVRAAATDPAVGRSRSDDDHHHHHDGAVEHRITDGATHGEVYRQARRIRIVGAGLRHPVVRLSALARVGARRNVSRVCR